MKKITTTRGEMDERQLKKVERDENGVHVVEYYFEDALVHRSAVTKIEGVAAAATGDLTTD